MQLRWRMRRGMKELDVVFERYLARRLDQAPPAEQQQLAALLDCEDPEIWDWLMERKPAPPEFIDVIGQLRRHP